MFQTNLREVDAGLDVELVLDYIQDFGADAWLLSVGGIISGYPSSLPFQTPNPALGQRESGDLVGDAIAATHARGMKLLARMDFSKVSRRIAEEHPEWCFVDPRGAHQTYNGLTSVCPSAEYYQEKVFEILAEVLDRYPVDGFFFNWLSYGEVDYEKNYRGVCHCVACQRAFGDFAPGTPLPDDRQSPTYQVWKKFSTQMLSRWTARAREFISERRPEAPLIMGTTSDIVFHESNNGIGRPLWHHLTTEHVSVAKSYRPDVPVLVNAAAFVDMPYRLAGEEPHHYVQYLVQAIARGANPSIYIMGTPEETAYECLDPAREIIQFHRTHSDAYAGLRPSARTALVRPDPLSHAAEELERSSEEFRGLWNALLERHVPFDILAEERIEDLAGTGEIDRYALIVLPDLGPLTDATAGVLDEFVFRGGRLLATGSSGLIADVPQLKSLGIAARTASKDTRELTWSSHLVPDEPPGSRAFPLPLIGAYQVVLPVPGAETGMHLLSTAPYGPPEKCYGHYELAQPGWISHQHGQGRTVLMPWTVGRGYREVGLSAARDLFVDQALRLLGPDLEVETDLPEQVEVIVGRSELGQVVHLRNLSGATVQKFLAPLPVSGRHLTIRNAEPGSQVRSLVSGQTLTADPAPAGGITVALPELGLFEVLVIS